jgi:hypothetical protein
MSTVGGDFGVGGRVLLAIPLLVYGLISAAWIFSGPSSPLRVFTVIFGIWMVVVAHFVLLTERRGYYLAIPTYGWLGLNAIVGVVSGVLSGMALIWITICLAAVVHSIVALRRTRVAHAI